MSEQPAPRYGIDPYLDWVKKEGLPVAEDYALDLFSVETADWPRYGVKGAAAHLKGRGSTQIGFDDGQKRGFEWGPKSLFSIPLNAKHRHFNGSGSERALLATTTN